MGPNSSLVGKSPENAILIGLITDGLNKTLALEHLDELEFLAATAGIHTVKVFLQSRKSPDPHSFVGKGKLKEVAEYVKVEKVDCIIFDDDLSPSQLRNIENTFGCKIYDRSLLILDIFLQRAHTSQAKTQVELARFQYLLPRLTRMWTHLERQRGGTGTRGGAGEKEIETDRRAIRNQIKVLKGRLEKIEKQKQNQRKGRTGTVRVSLIGYTNVGKSTIMNLLTKSDVVAEDKLFATVDSTVRKVYLENIPFLLSDTVGFIRKLPHHLIESFKSTLDEIREADILLHVVDASHEFHDHHISVVETTLREIGVVDKPVLTVYNKIDALQDREEETINSLNGDAVFISAKKMTNIQALRDKLINKVKEEHVKIYPNYLE